MRVISAICLALLLQNAFGVLMVPAAYADPVNLDLSSTTQSVPASSLGTSGSVLIRAGGGVATIHPSSMITPAQYAAATQVLSTGRQTLEVGAAGQATGGRFAATGNILDLVVPNGVTMLQNFAAGNVSLGGNLINAGNIYAYSTNNLTTTAVLNAANIHNQAQGLISSIVPASVLSGAGVMNAIAGLNLSLNTTGNLVNEGTISSAGHLNINAGGTVRNAGMIASQSGNVNFNSANNIYVDNTSGRLSTPNGVINFRTPDFTEKKDLLVRGGVAEAKEFNLNSGDGHIRVDMERIDGNINIDGGTAVVATHDGDQTITKLELTGDPAFYNTKGNINLNTDIVLPGQDVAIVASRNITFGGVGHRIIDTSSAAGDGGDITVVAGARFTTNGPDPVTASADTNGAGDAGSLVQIQGPSAAGGGILWCCGGNDVSTINSSSSALAGNGGKIQLIAFKQDNVGFSGQITVQNSAITSTGGIGGTGGDVSIISNETTQIGSITTGGGKLLIQSSLPVISGGSGTYDMIGGTVQPGSGSFVASPTLAPRGFSVGAISTSGGDVKLAGGAQITTNGSINAGAGNVDVTVFGGSQSFNASGDDITAGSVKISVNNGSAIVNDIATTGNVDIFSGGKQIHDVTINGSGSFTAKNVSGCCSGNSFHDITTQDGSINFKDTNSYTVNNLRTHGGNINVDIDGSLNAAGYVIAADDPGTAYGNVDIGADQGITISGFLNSQYGNESAPVNNALVGHSILLGPGNGVIVMPIDNLSTTGLTYSSAHGITINNLVAIDFANTPSVNTATGSDITAAGQVTAGGDFIALSNQNVTVTSAVNANAVSGPGGHVLVRAGAHVTTPSGFVLSDLDTLTTGGNAELQGIVSTNGGGQVIVGSQTVSSNKSVTVSGITASDGGTISLFNGFPGGLSGTINVNGPLSAPGSATHPDGGNIVFGGGNVAVASGPQSVDVSGSGSGNGGSVTITLFGFSPSLAQISGSGASSMAISANSGNAGGNGGTILIQSAFDGVAFNIDSSGLSAVPLGANGNGGDIRILNIGGSISITGVAPLSVNGVGTGDGGVIVIGSAGGFSGINTTVSTSLSADSGTDGSGGLVFLEARGGSTTFNSAGSLNFTATGNGLPGKGGTVTVTNLGAITLNVTDQINLDASANGYGDGGAVTFASTSNTAPITVGNVSGGITADARGGSPGSNAGNGGIITIQTAGDLSVDTASAVAMPQGTNGNGAAFVFTTNTGAFTLFTTNATSLNASAVGAGEGGSLGIDVASVTAPTVSINTGISANGGVTWGNGGTIDMFHSFSPDGLEIFGQGLPQIVFASGTALSASAPTIGNGGSITIWANSFDLDGSNLSITATGASNLPVAQGGRDVSGGGIGLLTSGATGSINIGTQPDQIAIDARGFASGGAIANGGGFGAFARGGGNVNVDPTALLVNPDTNGNGGSVNLVAIHNGPHHDFAGGFQYDDYAGTVNIIAGVSNVLNLNGTTGRDAGNLIIEVNSLAPVLIQNTTLSLNTDTSGAQGDLIISNVGPGGVRFENSVINANNPSGAGGNINITASNIQVTNGLPISAQSSTVGQPTVIVATTAPAPIGSLSLGNGSSDISIDTSGSQTSTVRVMAGGDLTVDVANGLITGDRPFLLLSAGVVSKTVSFPFVNGPPPEFTNTLSVDPTRLSNQTGNLLINGSLSATPGGGNTNGGQIILISNSFGAFTVGGAVSNGITGTISTAAGIGGAGNGDLVIANFGVGGITVNSGTITTAGPNANGSRSAPTSFDNNELPIKPTLGAASGLVELYSFQGPVSINQNIDSNGGTIYIAGSTVSTPPLTRFNVSRNGTSGQAGAVYVTTSGFGLGDLTVGSSGFQIDASPGSTSGNGGIVSVTASGALTVDPASLVTAVTSGIGPQISLTANNGNLFVQGSLNADAGGANAGGSITLISGGSSIFNLGLAGTNGVSGSLSATGNTNGTLTVGGTNSGAGTFTVFVTSDLSNFSSLTFQNDRFEGMSVFVPLFSSGLIPGTTPVTATSKGTLTINQQIAGNGLTIANATSYGGGVNIIASGGTLQISNNAKVLAEGGPLFIQNDDANGIINIGNNVLLSGSGVSAELSAVNVIVGSTVPNPPVGSAPGTGTVVPINGGNVFANGTVTTVASDKFIAATSNVALNAGATGTITVGTNSIIQSITFSSLDLTDAANLSYLNSLRSAPANVISGGGSTYTIPEAISRIYTAFNIPSGSTVNFNNLSPQASVIVNSPGGSIATLNGTLAFTGTATTGTITFFPSSTGTVQLNMGSSGLLINTTVGDLNLTVVGPVNMAGTARIETINPSYGTTLNLLVSSGDLTLGRLTGPTAILTVDSDRNIFQAAGGFVKGNDIQISGGTFIGTTAQPINLTLGDAKVTFFTALVGNNFTCSACTVNLNAQNNNLALPLQLSPVTLGGSFTVASDVSLTASGNGGALTANTISLRSTGGYIGNNSSALGLNATTLTLNATSSTAGIVNVTNGADSSTLLNSSAGIGFVYSPSGLGTASVNDIYATTGDIVVNASNGLTVQPGSTIIAQDGNVILFTTFGNILVGNGSFIGAISSGPAASVSISVLTPPTNTPGTTPANVVESIGAGASVFYGNDGILANAPDNFVFSNGNGSVVAFDTNGQGTSAITLDGNVTVLAGGGIAVPTQLTSLDLTDTNVQNQITALQAVGLIGGDAQSPIIKPFNLAPSVTAFNVPGTDNLNLQSFTTAHPVNITLSSGSATLSGTLTSLLSPTLVLNVTGGSFDIAGGLVNGADVTIAAPSMNLTSGNIMANTAVTLTSPVVNFDSTTISSPVTTISNTGALTLTTSGVTATTITGNTILVSSTGALTFTGGQSPVLDANSILQAPSITLLGTDLVGTSTIELRTGSFVPGGSVLARQFEFTAPTSTGKGTIANPNGDVVLSTNLKFNGQSLAILASGNIVAKSTFTSIDLSNSKGTVNSGNGGDLILIAGFDFTTTNSASTTPILGTYDLTGPSAGGGSILLPNVRIKTSSSFVSTVPITSPVRGGNVTAIAAAGTQNSGSVILNSITANGNKTNGVGGHVLVIGQGGVITGNISTVAAGGGMVEIYAYQPVLVGHVAVTDGVFSGAGAITPLFITTQFGSNIRVGNVTTTGSVFSGGNFLAFADNGITTGTVTTQGLANYSTVPFTQAGGSIQMIAAFGPVSTKGLTSSALSLPSSNNNDAGGGGPVVLSGSAITVSGSVNAAGGKTAGNGNGGNGGLVMITTNQSVIVPPAKFGGIKITGGISTAGGNVKTTGTATPGGGADVVLDGATVSVGSLSGFSVNTGGGTRGTAATGTAGDLSVVTYAVQSMSTNFDLTSKTASEFAIPGGLFTFNAGSPVNGFSSPVRTSVVTKKVDVGGNGLIFPGTFGPVSGITITVQGSSFATIDIDGTPTDFAVATSTGVRSKVTPSVAVALYQVTSGIGQTLEIDPTNFTAVNGSVLIPQADIPTSFKSFKVPTNVDVEFSGPSPLVTLPSSTLLNGHIVFSGGTEAAINFGSASPTISGGIDASGLTLTFIGTGSTINYASVIIADTLVLARPTASALKLVAKGGMVNVSADQILLSHAANQSMSLTVNALLGSFTPNVNFGNVLVPTRFDNVATAMAKQYTVQPKVALNFTLNGSDVANVGGTVSGAAMTIKTVSGKSGTATILTDLIIDPSANFSADKNVTITSCGDLTVSVGSSLNAGTSLTPGVATTKGSVLISSTSATQGGTMNIGGFLNAIGGDIKITQKTTSPLNLGFASVQAQGGNVIVLGKGTVDLTNTSITSIAFGTSAANQKGGGVEIGSGTNTSKLSTILGQPSGTVPSPSIIGLAIFNGGNTRGVIQRLGGGTINPFASSSANVSNGGAILFQSQLPDGNLSANGLSIFTVAFKPVATDAANGGDDDYVIDTADDEMEGAGAYTARR